MPRSSTAIPVAAALLLALAMTAASSSRASATVLPDSVADSLLVGGLDFPVGLAFLPDGRLLVVEQKTTRLRLVAHGAIAPGDPVAMIPDVEISGTEQGLLGVAVDPRWPSRPYLYLHMDDAGGFIRISRYTATGDLGFTGDGSLDVNPTTRYDLVSGLSDIHPNHNGGTLRFGKDGMLYASLGDDALGCPAQDTTQLVGKILRLDVMRLPDGPGAAPFALVAAAGNPFANHPDSAARLVWAMGLRNPFRFHIDPLNGVLYIGDVGETHFEEIDRVVGGGLNFGWPMYEALQFTGVSCQGGVRGVDPIYNYDRSTFTAAVVSGGVYRRPPGAARGFPTAYEGSYFFSDYYAGFLRRLVSTSGVWSIAPAVAGQPSSLDWGEGFDGVSDYLVGPDGAIWYCRQSVNFAPGTGAIRRLVSLSETQPPGTTDTTGARTVEFRTWPQPAPGAVQFGIRLPRPAAMRVVIYDCAGRAVRAFHGSKPPAGWDGTDQAGRRLKAGVYFVRLEVENRSYDRRIVLLR